MSLPSAARLLKSLDPLPHGARLGLLADLGRAHRDTPALRSLVRALLDGDVSSAHLALQLAMASRDTEAVSSALDHPAVSVQHAAANWLARHGDSEAAVLGAVASASPSVRRRLLKSVSLGRRTALAEQLFDRTLVEHGAAEAALLLPSLSPTRQARALPEVAHVLGTWRTLGLQQPDIVLAFLARELRGASEAARPAVFARYATAFRALTLRRPGPVVALLNETAPADHLPDFLHGVLPRLLRHAPDATLTLLLRPGVRAALPSLMNHRGAMRALARAPHAWRLQLARAIADWSYLLAGFLTAAPHAERPGLLAHAWAEARPIPAPLDVLATLPTGARDHEAAAELQLRQVQESEPLRRSMLALRRSSAALEELLTATRAAKAEDRAMAWRHVIACVGRERAPMELLFAQMERLRNEQDPVREAALSALSTALPVSHFHPDHVAALRSQVTWATEARDASRATHAALQRLAFRLLTAHAATPDAPLFGFALWTLERLAGQSGTLQLPSLEQQLPRGAETALVEALLPRLRSARARESHPLILSVATALGRRAWEVEPLQRLLESITSSTPEWMAQQAIALWLAPPRTRDVRVRKLLDRDGSVALLPEVFDHLHRRRQDWLDPLLADAPLKGRFATGKTLWIAPLTTGLFRWLPRQQERLRARQSVVASDQERSGFERAAALASMARLPTTRLAHLAPFTASAEVQVSEAALSALAWIEEPTSALPVLLGQLEGDRARVATYALARTAKRSPPPVITRALEGLLSRERLKISVHKEAVRLLASFPSKHSLELLRDQLDRPGLHRDVRIAVGHALRRLLSEEMAWSLLGPLAGDTQAEVAESLLDASPQTLALQHRPRYGALLLTLARHPEARTRMAAWNRIAPWVSGIEPQVARAAAGCIGALEGTPEWKSALRVLSRLASNATASDLLVACAASLLEQSEREPAEATPERDLPASQRLAALLDRMVATPRSLRRSLGTLLERLASVTAVAPAWWSEQASLRLATLDLRDAEGTRRLVAQLTSTLEEDPLRQGTLATALSKELSTLDADEAPEALCALADQLETTAPLAALAVVESLGDRLRWAPMATERLARLRRHPVPSVRGRARRIVTAVE